jgi:hypothetical protein
MEKEILYTTAVDKNGNLIHIDNAEKGINYYCPCPWCKKEFILRKSGKTGKGSRRPHFAHNELSPNCTPEGYLHYTFKRMLIDLLEKCKAEKKPFILNWACSSCGYKNSGNLLEKAAFIKEEYVLGECRPDIALVDNVDKVLAVIELVDTHKPEESVLQYYKENKITIIQINLTSDEDLIKVEEKAKNPDIVDLCLSPKCPNRDKYVINRKITFQPHRCSRCFYPIEKYFIEIDSVFGKKTSCDFTNEEIDLVKSISDKRGIRVEIGTNQSTNERYPIFMCLNCLRMRSNRNRFRF